ncbi:lipopolysaccharide export system permease protein [Myroides marinus]|uniref:Lipopolysaccharide export system permease protein n=1 Tax=Myroides marinus TaxID=703342 RepID=A0A1H6X9Q9_9FLAO|nr:LptF/LptG family permease [Myroides marinus]SEJ25893.1 lipopolysaccharide export system permease protein [Myroides marinus]
MKILDRYILKSFISTLLTVFAILYFIFILQGVWLFISELAGKDLDLLVVVKFLLFYSPKMVPLVLPLSVLLASIMTFGSFAENYEFAAMKASGISLKRAMRPLSIFIFVLAGVSFWFANDVIPKAEYKFLNLRKEIIQTKPAMAIAAGQFNDLGQVNIKVDSKTGDKGEYLDNVTMHVKSNSGYENKTVIRSVNGELETEESSSILKLHLFDGNYYDDVAAKNYEEQKKHPFIKTYFTKYTMNIDLSSFQNEGKDEEKITNTYGMLNIKELNYTIDSLQKALNTEMTSNADNLTLRLGNLLSVDKNNALKTSPADTDSISSIVRDSLQKVEAAKYVDKAGKDILKGFSYDNQSRILQSAVDYTNNISFNAESNDLSILNQVKRINDHWLALYEKFVIAFSCFLMFYIGAPLGAIIRKGGIGLPIVFAVGIFITYHFINTFGKKMAQEDGITPFLGGWIGSLVLTPLAIYLTYKATKDNGDVNFSISLDTFKDLFASVKGRFNRKKEKYNKKQL